MITDKIGFVELSKQTPEHAWVFLEKLYSKGDREAVLQTLNLASPDFFAPSDEDLPARASFLARMIKNGELAILTEIFQRSPDSTALRQECRERRFGSICESRSPEILDLLLPLPVDQPNHKEWSMALLRKNMPLLDRLAFSVESKRALILIENYFFDLQLSQLKYLEQHIEPTAWPMRFARDAIQRNKGPGAISFFIDHGFQNPSISHLELWESIAAAIKTQNGKAFSKLITGASKLDFDWARKAAPGEIPLASLAGHEPRLLPTKLPPELKKMTLLELAIARGQVDMTQDLIDQLPDRPADDRIQLLLSNMAEQLTQSRADKPIVQFAQAQAQSALDFALMQLAASPQPDRVQSKAPIKP